MTNSSGFICLSHLLTLRGGEQGFGSTSLASARIVDFTVNRADSRILKNCGSWISCEFWRGFRIVPVLMFGSWVLKELGS